MCKERIGYAADPLLTCMRACNTRGVCYRTFQPCARWRSLQKLR